MTPFDVMVVAPIPEVQQAFAGMLGLWGLAPIVASSVSEAKEIVARHQPSLVFYWDEFPDDTAIDDFIQRASQRPNNVPVAIVSRLDDWERFVGFLRRGAFDYVLYPLSEVEIARIVRNALGFVQSSGPQRFAAAS
jgi:DNA-binding NtrC family response regulator